MALNIQVVISALDKFSGPVNGMTERMQGLRNAGLWMTGAGTAMAGGLLAAANQAAKTGSELNDMSMRTGISAEALSELKYAAEQTGGSLATVEKAARFAQRTADEAALGTKEYAEAYERLGVSVLDSNGQLKDGEALLTEVGEALRGVTNDSERTALAMTIFGRSGTQMLSMIMDAKGGVTALREEARRLGLTLTNEQVAALDDYGDATDRLKSTMGAAMVQVGLTVIPALQKVGELFVKAASSVARFAQEHPTMSRALGMAALAIAGVMLALGPLLIALPGAIMAWGKLTAAMNLATISSRAVAAAQGIAAAATTVATAAAAAGANGWLALGAAGVALIATVILLAGSFRSMIAAQDEAIRKTGELEAALAAAEKRGYVTPQQVAQEMGFTKEQFEEGLSQADAARVYAEVRKRRQQLGKGDVKTGESIEERLRKARLNAQWYENKARELEGQGNAAAAEQYQSWADQWAAYAATMEAGKTGDAEIVGEIERMRVAQAARTRAEQRAQKAEQAKLTEQLEKDRKATDLANQQRDQLNQQADYNEALATQADLAGNPYAAMQYRDQAMLLRAGGGAGMNPLQWQTLQLQRGNAMRQAQTNIYIDARGASPSETQKAVRDAYREAEAQANFGYAAAY